MKITIDASRLIDTLIAIQDDYDAFYREVPRNAYIAPGSAYERKWKAQEAAHGKLNAINDATGIPMWALDRAMHITRKWYKRTRWQRCLPDGDANRLLTWLVNEHTRDFRFRSGYYSSTGRKIKA